MSGSTVEATSPQRVSLEMDGLHCPDCALVVEKSLASLDGVRNVRVSVISSRADLEIDPARVGRREIESRLRSLGYGVRRGGALSRRQLALTGTAAVLVGLGFVVGAVGWGGIPVFPFFGVALLLAGFPIARRGIAAARRMALDMNFLMTTAAAGAVAIGEWSEGAVAIVLFSVANLLESYSMDRTRRAVRALMELAPEEALVKRDGREEAVALAQVRPGEILLVRPGGRIPLDGEIRTGSSAVNEAPITGESLPVEKAAGDAVYGGSVNLSGFLEVRVRVGSEEGTLARIVHLVQEAQARRAPVEGFVDRFARVYTPLVVLGAILAMVLPPLLLGYEWGEWFKRGLVLLVIACPCALVISTPVTIVSALTAAARLGVLVKGGMFLEEAARLKAVAFDKTGTLTYGELRVVGVKPRPPASEREVLEVASSAGALSEHPLSRAVVRRARELGIKPRPVRRFAALSGRGMRAEINGKTYLVGNARLIAEAAPQDEGPRPPTAHARGTAEANSGAGIQAGLTSVMVAGPEGVLGEIEVADTPRRDARPMLAELRSMGIEHLVMLSGDNPAAAERLGRELGISETRAGLLPEEKVRAVEDLRRRYQQVGMVGDGVNDAPALAAASLGVAMGLSGTDAALETADVTLVSDDLSRLPRLVALARRTVRTVHHNIAFAIGIKALFVTLAIPGYANLWMAVFADMGASLLVTLNGMRLLTEVRRR